MMHEGQKTRASSSILWQNYWELRAGKTVNVFWFCGPVEDLGGGPTAVRKGDLHDDLQHVPSIILRSLKASAHSLLATT